MTSTTMELAWKLVDAATTVGISVNLFGRDSAMVASRVTERDGAKAALEQRIKELEADAARWKAAKELAGHWQDGSNETVKLFQDDATRTYHIACGRQSYFGNSFNEAIDRAMSEAALQKLVDISQEYKLP